MDFYDGQGANAIGLEKEQIDELRGGPLTDGTPIGDLNKMVGALVGVCFLSFQKIRHRTDLKT